MAVDEEVLIELKRLNATLNLAFGDAVIEGLTRVATTDDRKRIWAAIDGVRTTKVMATELGIPRRTIDNFLSIAEEAGLIINPHGKPAVRLVSAIPANWGRLKPLPPSPEGQD